LGLVDWVKGFHRFHVHYDPVLYDQIHTISEFEFMAVIDNRKADLGCCFEASGPEFMGQTRLIGAFQKART
jgi:hypothetical protein